MSPAEKAELSRWDSWQAYSGLWYARRRKTSPPLTVWSEDRDGLPALALAAIRERRERRTAP